MDIKSMSLQVFLSEVYKQLELEQVTFEVFKSINSIVIIRSASLEIFEKFIVKIREINPDIYLYIITHSRDKENISKICKNNYEIIEYFKSGMYQLSEIKGEIKYLKGKNIDSSVVLYNNRYGMGFDNIEEILVNLNRSFIFAFNCYNELFDICNPELHIESLRLYNAMCNWYWEYIGIAEERDIE